MGKRSVNVRVTPKTDSLVRHAVPPDWTPSEWICCLVECLVDRPQSSQARGALKALVEDSDRVDYDAHKKKECTLMFRVSPAHWSALASLAAETGFKRVDYLRRVLYVGSIFKSYWFGAWLREEDPFFDSRPRAFRIS